MGLDNRDYLRDESRRYTGGFSGGGGGGISASQSPMCRNLLIVTIVVFLAQIFSVRSPSVEEIQVPKISVVQSWLELDSSKVLSGQVWRLLTCAFCHDREDVSHILFNMLFLWWFGRTLEGMYGSREFLWFYLTAALAASLAYVVLDLATGDLMPMIGASGAVMAVTMLFAVHYPRQTIYLFFVIPVEIRWIVLFYVVYDLHPVLLQLSGSPSASGVAHAAHLGGLAFGYFYAKNPFRLDPTMERMQIWWKSKRRGLRVVGSSDNVDSRRSEKLAEQMDAILKKVGEQGEASLTAAERKTLERASRELRKRRD
ncbi:MAG: rhomboid family intramembrane serine protease [Fuerstiella sp.]|nr:rhomboid family intramembrane serine protease [Fuerstiella sp.]